MSIKNIIGGINSNTIKSPFGVSGVGNIGLSFGQNGPSLSANFNQLLKKRMQATDIKGETSDLFKKPVEETIVFPKDLNDEHYMIIYVKNRVRASADKADKKRTFQTIALPIPSNLKSDYALNYEQASLGILGGKTAGRGSFAEAGQDLSALLGGKFSSLAGSMGMGTSTDGDTRGANDILDSVLGIGGASLAAYAGKKLGGGMLGAAIGAGAVGADQVGTALLMKQGIAINPHLAQVFKGVGLRSFNFSWKFVPRDEEESRIINQIVTTFKRYAHPAYFAGEFAFDYPMEFEIEFSEHIAPHLFRINRSVLQGISVDYGSEGLPLFFDEGNPVSVTLGLNFQETQIMTAEDFGAPRRSAGSDTSGEFEAAKPGSKKGNFVTTN